MQRFDTSQVIKANYIIVVFNLFIKVLLLFYIPSYIRLLSKSTSLLGWFPILDQPKSWQTKLFFLKGKFHSELKYKIQRWGKNCPIESFPEPCGQYNLQNESKNRKRTSKNQGLVQIEENFNPMNSSTFVLFGKYCPIVDQLSSKDSSRDFHLNCAISYFFYLHLMLHASG